MSWREVFPPELHEPIERSLHGEDEDASVYISIIPGKYGKEVKKLSYFWDEESEPLTPHTYL